jgi:anti-sigma-K factor RskA
MGWRFPPRLVPAGLVAGLILIVMLGISNLVLWQRLNGMEMVRGPLGMRAIALQNTGAASAASGFVVISADGADGVLVVDELPQLDEEHEYQAWLVRDGVNTDAGVFGVDESGYRGMRLDAPESLLSYSDIYVTVEPTGGSKAPTGAQVLNGSLFNR